MSPLYWCTAASTGAETPLNRLQTAIMFVPRRLVPPEDTCPPSHGSGPGGGSSYPQGGCDVEHDPPPSTPWLGHKNPLITPPGRQRRPTLTGKPTGGLRTRPARECGWGPLHPVPPPLPQSPPQWDPQRSKGSQPPRCGLLSPSPRLPKVTLPWRAGSRGRHPRRHQEGYLRRLPGGCRGAPLRRAAAEYAAAGAASCRHLHSPLPRWATRGEAEGSSRGTVTFNRAWARSCRPRGASGGASPPWRAGRQLPPSSPRAGCCGGRSPVHPRRPSRSALPELPAAPPVSSRLAVAAAPSLRRVLGGVVGGEGRGSRSPAAGGESRPPAPSAGPGTRGTLAGRGGGRAGGRGGSAGSAGRQRQLEVRAGGGWASLSEAERLLPLAGSHSGESRRGGGGSSVRQGGCVRSGAWGASEPSPPPVSVGLRRVALSFGSRSSARHRAARRQPAGRPSAPTHAVWSGNPHPSDSRLYCHPSAARSIPFHLCYHPAASSGDRGDTRRGGRSSPVWSVGRRGLGVCLSWKPGASVPRRGRLAQLSGHFQGVVAVEGAGSRPRVGPRYDLTAYRPTAPLSAELSTLGVGATGKRRAACGWHWGVATLRRVTARAGSPSQNRCGGCEAVTATLWPCVPQVAASDASPRPSCGANLCLGRCSEGISGVFATCLACVCCSDSSPYLQKWASRT